ncbi:hypothetical protein R6Q57_002232, partial [Mikania cordata]
GKKRNRDQVKLNSVVESSPVKPEGMNNLRRFGHHIPSMFHCYVSNIQDVKPDVQKDSGLNLARKKLNKQLV